MLFLLALTILPISLILFTYKTVKLISDNLN